MVSEAVAPVIRGLPFVDEVMTYDPMGRHAGFGGFWRLVSEFRAHQFRIALILQVPFKIALAAVFARIRYRVGPLSKIHSYLFKSWSEAASFAR